MKLIMLLLSLTMLTSCTEISLITNVEGMNVSEAYSVTFERDRYALNEWDEVFYRIDNHSDELFHVSEIYFIEIFEDDEWTPVNNDSFKRADSSVTIPPGESAEFIFWLSVNSREFEPGHYRAVTGIHLPEQTEDMREQYETHPPVTFEVTIPFEIR